MKTPSARTHFLLLSLSIAAAGCADGRSEEGLDQHRSTYGTGVTIGDDDGGPSCEPVEFFDVNARRSLFETHEGALSAFSMHEVLSAIATNSGLSANPAALHDQLMDTFDIAPGVSNGAHCDDDIAFDGSPGLNGYPLQCPRAEHQQVGNIDEWFPIAAVNRFDLAPSDGSNCGEARLVFANRAPIGPGRSFIIFEAKVPNPDPGCGIDACAPVQEFWADLTHQDNPFKRGELLRAAFLDGHPGLEKEGFGAFVNTAAFGFGGGQVRTNSFNQGPWTLREFKTVALFDGAKELAAEAGATALQFVPVPVAANPFGELWDESTVQPHSKECAQALLATVENLMTDDPNLMGVAMPTICLAAESPSSSLMNYPSQLVDNGLLAGAIEKRIQQVDPDSGLDATHIARRALFAGGCIGCHQLSNGGQNNDLGNAVDAPTSLGFVHTHEAVQEDCGDGDSSCFLISSGLKETFLPHRKAVMDAFLNDGPCCESPIGILPVDPIPTLPVEPIPVEALDVNALLEAEAVEQQSAAPLTVAGQSTHRAH
jgi:hypothetical protein